MGLLNWFKKGRRKKDVDDMIPIDMDVQFLEPTYKDLEDIDFEKFNTEDKKEYIASLRENIDALNNKNKALKAEYRAVSSYLSDIQLIDTMPPTEHEKLERLAKHVVNLTIDRKIYQTTESRISNSRYVTMQHYEDEVKDAIIEMANEEQRVSMIKHDMKIMDAQKFMLRDDAKEYAYEQRFVNNITLITFLALVSVVFVYLLSSYFKPDTKHHVFMLAILLVLVLLTITVLVSRSIKYKTKLTELKINRAIVVHNKLKIKYVNAVSQLDYKKDKYDVNSAYELGRLYELYLEAKRERERYMNTASEINEAMNKIMAMLKNLNLYDYSIWQNEYRALSDKREMVEIRHRLNTRRAKIRSQMEDNEKTIEQYDSIIKLYSINYDLTK